MQILHQELLAFVNTIIQHHCIIWNMDEHGKRDGLWKREEFAHMDPQNKDGEAIYVDKNFTFRVSDNNNNIHKCISIEMCKKENKTVILSCIYRIPGFCEYSHSQKLIL